MLEKLFQLGAISMLQEALCKHLCGLRPNFLFVDENLGTVHHKIALLLEIYSSTDFSE